MRDALCYSRKQLLTPWLVRAPISFSISGQCWGHSLFIISTVMRDRASLIWLSSSRIERVPWWDAKEISDVYDREAKAKLHKSVLPLTFDNSCMAHSFSWTFSCCGMLFHLNLQEKKSPYKICSSNMSDFFKLIIITSYSLDDVLQDLQTKVSHHSWLGFVSQL